MKPHSDGCFVKAYPTEDTESFLDGHVSAFAFLGGVALSILYDNTKIAVVKILGDGKRECTKVLKCSLFHNKAFGIYCQCLCKPLHCLYCFCFFI